jgi:cysteine desulfurase / selenocysteine lyase
MSDLIYLDNGSTTFPKPEGVYRRMDDVSRRYAVNPGRGAYALCHEAGAIVAKTRQALCAFFGGTDPNRLVFGQNATDVLNLAIFGLVRPGDHVISTRIDHNATIRPLQHLRREGAEVEWVGFDAQGYVDPLDIIHRIRLSTRAVVMNHASNVLGTIQPVEEVGRVCLDRGIPLILDVSQTAGTVDLDMEALGASVLCFPGHKSLLGPMGVGGMYVREGLEIRHTRAGGTGIRSADPYHLDEYPYRMEYGTCNLPGIAGLGEGVRWILERGIGTIHQQEMRLLRPLWDGLQCTDGVTVMGQGMTGRRVALMSFTVNGLTSNEVAVHLDAHGIASRPGLHCAPLVHQDLGTDLSGGTVRLSLGPFTTEADIDAALVAVREIAKRHGN